MKACRWGRSSAFAEVIQVEAAEEGLSPAAHVRRCGGGGRAPQPDRFRVTVTGQAIDLQADQRAVQDKEFFLGVLQPGAAVSESGMHPVPGRRGDCAIAGGVRGGRDVGLVPAVGFLEREDAAMPAGMPPRGPDRTGPGLRSMTRSERRRPASTTGRSAKAWLR